MIRKPTHFHIGLDHTGHRHQRLRGAAEVRRMRERERLHPSVILVLACQYGRPLWRNGLQRRRWLILSRQVRGDRSCFLMTLARPPLVAPLPPF